MTIAARFGHTNLIARDWRVLAAFYEKVFGCTLVPPERNLGGEALERGSGIPGATLQGVHLRLPGWGNDGPTLEIFTYNTLAEGQPAAANRLGYGHIAFVVPDIAAAKAAVLAAGGKEFGEIVTTKAGTRAVTWTYLQDPEGNLVELQVWSS